MSLDGRRLEVRTCQPLPFSCTHCDKPGAAFLVYADQSDLTADAVLTLAKFGQWPSVRPQPDADVARALGVLGKVYTLGLTCEDHGFGIGAYAYYRRVTEDIIGQLMDDLKQHALDAGATELVGAIDGVAAETQASKRIGAVRDLLPSMLRPGGVNPLGVIYGALSDGLHSGADQDCLDQARTLRTALDFLLKTLEQQKATRKQFTKALQALSNSQGKKKPTQP